MARVSVPSEFNLAQIAADAGSTTTPRYLPNSLDGTAGVLEVLDVSQAALEAAFAAYDHLGEVKRRKIHEISAAYAAAFAGGFVSSALGTPHRYRSDPASLIKLLGATAAGEDGPFECAEIATGDIVLAAHTAAQLQTVLRDGKAAAVAFKQHERDLITQVRSIVVDSETKKEQAIAAVRAIVW